MGASPSSEQGGTGRPGDAAGAGLRLNAAPRPAEPGSGRASVPPEREVIEMKGKGSGNVPQRLGPLRRIVEVLRHADDALGTSRVRLECGHEGRASSGAIYKARCRRCRPAAALPPSS